MNFAIWLTMLGLADLLQSSARQRGKRQAWHAIFLCLAGMNVRFMIYTGSSLKIILSRTRSSGTIVRTAASR